MPFNFIDLETYQIDYKNLFEYFKNFPILDDESLQKKYLYKWIGMIEHSDELLVSQMNSKIQIFAHQQRTKKNKNYFVQDMHYGSNIVQIQFQVDQLNTLLKMYDDNIFNQKISTENFSGDLSCIQWQERKIEFCEKFNTEPIYILPFALGRKQYLVIDGNHRVTQAVQEKHSEISVIVLEEDFVIKNNIFPSEFDKLFYIFHNELSRFANNKIQNNITDVMLLDTSYLNTEKINF